MKIRKKPIDPMETEAIRVNEAIQMAKNCWHVLPDWFKDYYEAGHILICDDHIFIDTVTNGYQFVRTAFYDEFLVKNENIIDVYTSSEFKDTFEWIPEW